MDGRLKLTLTIVIATTSVVALMFAALFIDSFKALVCTDSLDTVTPGANSPDKVTPALDCRLKLTLGILITIASGVILIFAASVIEVVKDLVCTDSPDPVTPGTNSPDTATSAAQALNKKVW